MLLNFALKRLPWDAQHLSRLRYISLALKERPVDQVPLISIHRLIEGHGEDLLRGGKGLGQLGKLLFHICKGQGVRLAGNHAHAIYDDMLQFPDIPRPVIGLKALDQLVGDVADLLLKGFVVPLNKGLYKRLDALRSRRGGIKMDIMLRR